MCMFLYYSQLNKFQYNYKFLNTRNSDLGCKLLYQMEAGVAQWADR